MSAYLIIGIIAWLLCGLYAAGKSFAYLQEDYWRVSHVKREHLILSLVISLIFGPIAIFSLLINGELNHKWRLK